jgi:exonuclease III
MEMKFGTWNIISLYRASSLLTEKELSEYKLDSVVVQEVRWDRGGTEPGGENSVFHGERNENHELGTCSFVHKRII